MHLHKIAKPLQLFAVLPILTANTLALIPNGQVVPPTVVVSSADQTRLLVDQGTDNKQKLMEEEAQKIDQYFADRNLPLAGYGKKFVEEADKNGIPWNLLPSIAMIESTGYKFACQNKSGRNNGFGWGGCTIAFDSIDDAIETVSLHLGGNHPATKKYYSDKDVDQILHIYNPPKVRADYNALVKSVMKRIENYDIKTKAE